MNCPKCDQMFTDEESLKSHVDVDHGVEEAVTKQSSLHRQHIPRGKLIFPTDTEPEDEDQGVPTTGSQGYNPNPNAGLYNNKIFRNGSSTERNSALGEARASEDPMEGFNLWYYSTNWDKNSPELNIDLKEETLSYFGLPKAWAYLKWEDIPQHGKDKISSESKASEDYWEYRETDELLPKYEQDRLENLYEDFNDDDKDAVEDLENQGYNRYEAISKIATDMSYESKASERTNQELLQDEDNAKNWWDNMSVDERKRYTGSEWSSKIWDADAGKSYDDLNIFTRIAVTDIWRSTVNESKASEADGMQVDWWDSLSQDERNNWMNSFPMTPTNGSIYMDNYDEMDSSNQYYVKSLFRFVKDNTNNDLLGRNHDIFDESKASEDAVNYNKADDQSIGFIEQQHTEPKEDKNKELDYVNITEESIDYVYKTKSSEAKEKAYTTEAKMIEGLEEEYKDFEDSDESVIEETITVRKLGGYSEESIARELHITYGVSHEEALEKVYSVEVSTNDKVAQTFFGKMYKECTESEKDELRMYSGSD